MAGSWDAKWAPDDVVTDGELNKVAQIVIADESLDVDGSFDFTSIPQLYAHLRLILHLRSTDVANVDAVALRFNGESGVSDYAWARMASVGGVADTVADTADSELEIGQCPAASQAVDFFGITVVDIADYVGGEFKQVVATWFGTASPTSVGTVGGRWFSATATGAINRIQIFTTSTDNFLAGSRATLYGVNA